MPSALPDGDPAPPDGRLPDDALAALGERPLSFYLHVPYCSTRCGYCDFNTYTAEELGPGVSRATWADSAIAEIRLARSVLGEADLPVETVFVGGGTPTLLPPADLVRALDAIRDSFGLAEGAEVTTEANPDTVDLSTLRALADGGFTRVSYGMQSAIPHVLRALDRTHDPLRVPQVVEWARQAGLQTSLDLIYGAPGESGADWLASVEAAVACRPDHISAYALVVEEGTRLAAQVRRGEVAAPDDDVLADRYEAADALLAAAGFTWYEVSNWAVRADARCRHNLAYWRGDDWWGVGPGAHSHIRGTRWWNARHPAAWASALAEGRSPAQAREVLGAEARRVEAVLLGVRLAEGLGFDALDEAGRAAVPGLVAEGLVSADAAAGHRVVLTLRGRLLADGVVRALLP
jgi:oxygen-independent coproporphyrinogen-3 oxidase